jgi:hypothetical protein
MRVNHTGGVIDPIFNSLPRGARDLIIEELEGIYDTVQIEGSVAELTEPLSFIYFIFSLYAPEAMVPIQDKMAARYAIEHIEELPSSSNIHTSFKDIVAHIFSNCCE